MRTQTGFTLVELIAVIVIIGILAVAAATRIQTSSLQDLQAAREFTLMALNQAQQAAMAQEKAVRVIFSGSTLDIRQDSNNNNVFAADESLTLAGTRYPYSLRTGLSISSHTLDFNRKGETTAASITLTKGTATVTISLSAMGFAR